MVTTARCSSTRRQQRRRVTRSRSTLTRRPAPVRAPARCYQNTLTDETSKGIDEFSTSNFMAIKKASSPDATPTLVYPKSESILKSVTAKSLMDIARSLGWNVEHRPIPFQEVIDGGLEEVLACGTAAVRSFRIHAVAGSTLMLLSLTGYHPDPLDHVPGREWTAAEGLDWRRAERGPAHPQA